MPEDSKKNIGSSSAGSETQRPRPQLTEESKTGLAAEMENVRAGMERDLQSRMDAGADGSAATKESGKRDAGSKSGTLKTGPVAIKKAIRDQKQKQRDFERRNARATKIQSQGSTMNQASQEQKAKDTQARKAEIENAVKNRQKAAERLKASKAQLAANIKSGIKRKLIPQKQRAEMDALSMTIIVIAFAIAIFADLIEVIATITGIGLVFVPWIGGAASFMEWYLWWSIGAGSFNGRMKKVGKRALATTGVELIPGLDVLPALTLECVLNYLDFVGVFDKVGDQAKNVTGQQSI